MNLDAAAPLTNWDGGRTSTLATGTSSEPPKDNARWPPFTNSLIEDPLLNLPAVVHNPRTHKYHALNNLPDFVRDDLDVSRMEAIQKWLKICGKKGIYRPLHRQKGLLSRQVVVNEQADLHLTWDDDSLKIFIKPLPAYLLNHDFWITHICPQEKTFINALGFLRTYVHLLPHEIDFDLAIEERLLPKTYAPGNNDGDYSKGDELTWPRWRDFVKEFVNLYEDGTPQVLRKTRWEHSELRLGRLNLAYRLGMGNVLRGYTFGYQSYGSFLSRNSSWLIAAFAYVAIVHGAMQVGLGTPQLEGNDAFAKACYGFAVFSIVAPVGVLTILITWMVLLAIDNAIFALFKKKPRPKRSEDEESQPSQPTSNGTT